MSDILKVVDGVATLTEGNAFHAYTPETVTPEMCATVDDARDAYKVHIGTAALDMSAVARGAGGDGTVHLAPVACGGSQTLDVTVTADTELLMVTDHVHSSLLKDVLQRAEDMRAAI